MTDFTGLMRRVEDFGFTVNLEEDHYYDFESQHFNDGFELRRYDRRLQFIMLDSDEVLVSRGAVFSGEVIDFSDKETILSKHNLWTLYRGPIAAMPPQLFQDLLNLFNQGSEAEITGYFLDLRRIPSVLN